MVFSTNDIKNVAESMKTDSVSEIHSLQNSSDKRLQQAGDFEAESKLMVAEIKYEGIKVLHKLVAFKKGTQKFFESLFMLEHDTQKRLSDKIKRVVEKDIKLGSLPTLTLATEGLVYSQEEVELAELFENLITNTIDSTKTTHPAYVSILNQLNSEEAVLLSTILKQKRIAICDVRQIFGDMFTYLTLYRHLLPLDGYFNQKERNISTYVDNWIRLGLVSVNYELEMNEKFYQCFYKDPVYLEIKQDMQGKNIDLGKGVLDISDLGRAFAKSVNLID